MTPRATTLVPVVVIGGGPAGLAAAIAAHRSGLETIVADAQRPPIDKACGEGLMPDAVAGLAALGVRLSPADGLPFRGIRFVDGMTGRAVGAFFSRGTGFAVRRTILHTRLAERAAELGITLRWGTPVTLLPKGLVAMEGKVTEARWIIGADGLQSRVRQWTGLQPNRRERKRFGFRRHFRVAPWSDLVEIYWGPRSQIAVTPIAPDEVGVAMVTRFSELRLHDALRQLPALATKIGDSEPVTPERGAPAILRRLRAITSGNVALIGDASGSVDPVTGEGLGLAFRQALALAEALRAADLRSYERSHREIGTVAHRMSQLVQWFDGSEWLRRRAIAAFSAEPTLFARLLEANSTDAAPLGISDALLFGWRLARA